MSAPQLRRLFRQTGPADLYHALFHLLPFGMRQGRLAPKRVVVTLHDLIWVDYSDQVARTVLAAAWRRRLGLIAIPYALRTADHVICDSQATAQSAERWIPKARCTAIHLGVGDDFFSPATERAVQPTVSRGPYIAAFGVPKAYKNIRCLIRALTSLRDTWPTLALVLIGGDGGTSQDIQQAHLTERVIVTGPIADHEVRRIIRSAEIFVVPSIAEGFGLPVLEAMALGTPVVVSTTPALTEVAADAALSFESADPAALARVLTSLLEDKGLQQEMAARGRLRARQFRWSLTADRTLDVYDTLLGLKCDGPATEAMR